MVFTSTVAMWGHNGPFETSEHVGQKTWRKIPVDLILHQPHLENLISRYLCLSPEPKELSKQIWNLKFTLQLSGRAMSSKIWRSTD